jgi:CheY-like chemotaxis protein
MEPVSGSWGAGPPRRVRSAGRGEPPEEDRFSTRRRRCQAADVGRRVAEGIAWTVPGLVHSWIRSAATCGGIRVMTSNRPRLFITAGTLPEGRHHFDALEPFYELIEVASVAEARRAAVDGRDLVLLPGPDAAWPAEMPTDSVAAVLERIGEGVAVVDAEGHMRCANTRLRECDEETRRRFTEICLLAMEQFNQAGETAVPLLHRPGQKYIFDVGDQHYEVMTSIAAVDGTDQRVVTAVVGILWSVTDTRQLQSKIDAIDRAGSELLRIEASSIAKLNMAERLRLLEEKIVSIARELLGFENFEIRLIDRDSRQLELVIAVGISPLKIGEAFYVDEDTSGISGYVAATGGAYICDDVTTEPRYREGLENAASSLTVPLFLHDRVIGVFNIESTTPAAFDDNDRRFAEIFGRYIAMAMHILDLLVVERYTTNEQVTGNVLAELSAPLGEIASQTAAMRGGTADPGFRDGLDRIIEAVGRIRRRLEAYSTGPKSIVGAEQELHREEPDPMLQGKRVILADNEPAVREAISSLLTQKGCDVTVCTGGGETIDHLRQAGDAGAAFDLVISDIRMADRNGYEVFRAAKEASPDTPVILITGFGYDPHHSIVRASQEGLHSFLFKPLKASQLLEVVSQALAGH